MTGEVDTTTREGTQASTSTAPLEAAVRPPEGVVVTSHGTWRSAAATPLWMKLVRIALIVALILVAVYYLVPRVLDLVMTPTRLDQAIVHAEQYNPQLDLVVQHEQETLAALAALDEIDTSLADVRGTIAEVDAELRQLIDQIRGDVQGVLDLSDAEVQALLERLAALEDAIAGLNEPIGGAEAAVAGNRAEISEIMQEARSIARDVRAARTSAENSADNVDGGG